MLIALAIAFAGWLISKTIRETQYSFEKERNQEAQRYIGYLEQEVKMLKQSLDKERDRAILYEENIR